LQHTCAFAEQCDVVSLNFAIFPAPFLIRPSSMHYCKDPRRSLTLAHFRHIVNIKGSSYYEGALWTPNRSSSISLTSAQ
jgi:hypothetical protein